ncbi:hypothetical protein [Streptomyces sp. NPDC056921]|uniref:hypothetical protein n=1 Tax=Streptomyces sp. NPDC056921 TaxID=3345966 RepID=UPI003635C805
MLPGRTHDVTAARTHRICERQGVPVLADRRRPVADHRHQAQAPYRNSPHRNDPQPGTGRSTSARRTRRCKLEVLANLPQVPMQHQPHDVNRQGHPHFGETTLKTLTDMSVRLAEIHRRRRGSHVDRSGSERPACLPAGT